MNRTSGSQSRSDKRRQVLMQTRGFRGRRKNCYTLALRAANKSKEDAYIGRKEKKRFFRRLWNKLISIWASNNNTSYSKVIFKLLEKYGDRKTLYQAIRIRGLSGDNMASDLLTS